MRTPNTTDILNAIFSAEVELMLAKGMRSREKTLGHLNSASAKIREARTELLRADPPLTPTTNEES